MKKIITLFTLGICLNAQAVTFSNVITFGDSNTDTGNVFINSGNTTPAAPYFNGRFSNDTVWIETFTAGLGHDAVASLAGGDNYATGGATAGTNTTTAINTLNTQVGTYLTTTAGMADANALYVLWLGGNDIRQITAGTPLATVQADLTADLAALQTELNLLHAAGARNFLLPNLGDLGFSPLVVGTPLELAATAAGDFWNTGLAGVSANVDALAGTTVYNVDFHSTVDDLKNNPGAAGIVNTTQGAFTIAAPDANLHLFVDDLHYSKTAHNSLSAAALSAVPEPTSLTMLFLSTAGFLCRRKRQVA